MVFVNSMSDLFHKDVPFAYVHRVFDTMERADWHVYQVLTKRSPESPGRLVGDVAHRRRLAVEEVQSDAVGVAVGVDQPRCDHPAPSVHHRLARGATHLDDHAVDDADMGLDQIGRLPVEDESVDDREISQS